MKSRYREGTCARMEAFIMHTKNRCALGENIKISQESIVQSIFRFFLGLFGGRPLFEVPAVPEQVCRAISSPRA